MVVTISWFVPPFLSLSPSGPQVAGTEMGVTEPEATFSACFGAAFMMWHPFKYATLLAEKMKKHGTTAWLVNTGWTAGSYGVGHRMKLSHTRAIIDAIHDGSLHAAEYVTTPVFNLQAPKACGAVPSEVLQPETLVSGSIAHSDGEKRVQMEDVPSFLMRDSRRNAIGLLYASLTKEAATVVSTHSGTVSVVLWIFPLYHNTGLLGGSAWLV